MSMYVRVKRNHQTIFLHVEPNETVQSVKAQVGEVLGQSVENIRLYGSDRTRDMADGSSLAEYQDIKNDSIIYAVFRNEGGEGWERIDVNLSAMSGEMKG
ncbi:hypothetical protein NSK_000630 [Nannochloropsis salina CCMP1776]|uniref:Ubiquitin-like domain-containing protein n=1 Tax=Nannochloropsis salina CCMP1776 TaxID=1027361 RepID=A0A4D9D9A7_9STRA|nr:hypothetical protein NSK_000630 [Nannochloropsis salina CCMP1776]|eukprot:TFJ88281.1 hypothetical protein NSK_000630 [Nannochloropsis salina CCMP1776]